MTLDVGLQWRRAVASGEASGPVPPLVQRQRQEALSRHEAALRDAESRQLAFDKQMRTHWLALLGCYATQLARLRAAQVRISESVLKVGKRGPG